MFFDKNVPRWVVDLASHERSRVFYLTGPALPCGNSTKQSDPVNGVHHNFPASDVGYETNSAISRPLEHNTVSLGGDCLPKLTDEILRALKLWLSLTTQFISQTELFVKAGILSGSKQKRIKQAMLAHGLIREHIMQKGRGKIIYWEPTPKAWRESGIERPTRHSIGGFLHQGLAEALSRNFRKQGWSALIEGHQANGKSVDIVLRKGEEVIWVEIAVSEPVNKEISNILRDFSTNVVPSKLFVVCTSSKMRLKLIETIAAEPLAALYSDKIDVVLATDLLEMAL